MLPIWVLHGTETNTMPGICSLQVIVEAFLKGIEVNQNAFDVLIAVANSSIRGLKYIQKLEHIPWGTVQTSVSSALEFGISDVSIVLMAEVLGKKEEAEYFKKRAKLYTNYFDNVTGFFLGRWWNGSFHEPFFPLKSIGGMENDYAEGNAMQYFWSALYDVDGLIDLLGGEDAFIKKLDELFSIETPSDEFDAVHDLAGPIGQYAHGNEPSHHITYLYANDW